MYYFAKDGNYGPRSYLTEVEEREEQLDWAMIIPTWHWTDAMWELLKEEDGIERFNLASHYSIGVHILYEGTCRTCFLSREQLPKSSSIKEDTDAPITINADSSWVVEGEGELWTHTSSM